MVTQVAVGELTTVEQSLVEQVGCGEWLDLAGDKAVDAAAMRSWGKSRSCRASVIRDILLGRLAEHPDPRGLRLRGARITGRLDLESLSTDVYLELKDCYLREGILARHAHLAVVALAGCQLEHPVEPPLDGARLICSELNLTGARVIGHATVSAVNLAGAHIGGSLDCSGAKLRNASGPALTAYSLQVDQSMYLGGGFTATGSGDMGAVNLAGARIGGSLDCSEAKLRNASGPALLADGLQVSQGMYLLRFTASGTGPGGAIRLNGAHIGAELGCEGAELSNKSGPALFGDRLEVEQSLNLRLGFTATGSGYLGAVRLPGVRVGGELDCIGAELANKSGPALLADGLQVERGMYLRKGFTAIGAGQAGGVSLAGARIGGRLGCDGGSLRNDHGPALLADGLQVGQDMSFREGFTAIGADKDGAVRLTAARVDGSILFDGAELHNDRGPALSADGLQVGQDMQCDRLTAEGGIVLGGHIGRLLSLEGAALSNPGGSALLSDGLRVDGTMFCRNGFTAEGEVRLPGAWIGGRLYFDGAKLSNPGGRALVASRLTVGQDMFCRKQGAPGGEQPFLATGAVILTGAHVAGNLECTGAQLCNDYGPALHAHGLQVGQDMYLIEGFKATAAGKEGAVRLTGAHIGGNIDCSGATLQNDSGPALLAYGIQVGQDIYLTGKFTAISGGKREVINLRTARIGGAFDFEPKQLKHERDPHKRLMVDGLTYTGVPGPNRGQQPNPSQEPDLGQQPDHPGQEPEVRQQSGPGKKQSPSQRWLELLREGTPAYAAQPYQQLAAGYRALGDDRQARKTLIAQRDDQLARTAPRLWERRWGWITKITLGYGYKPWRALWCLAGVVVASCLLTWLLGAHGALAQTSKTAAHGQSCTVIQQVSVGLDLNLPVGTSVARAQCDLTTDSGSVTAVWLTAAGWVLRVLAWMFAALFIAGFTSAVRKT